MSNRCHVATRKGLFTFDRGNSRWSIRRTSFTGDNCTLVMHDPRNGDLIAALNHGHFGVKMHRSRDGASTWAEIATPKYPEKPANYVPQNPVEGKAADWSLKLVWALAPGGPGEPGVVWCGTLPGGLFRSADSGDSWELNRSTGSSSQESPLSADRKRPPGEGSAPDDAGFTGASGREHPVRASATNRRLSLQRDFGERNWPVSRETWGGGDLPTTSKHRRVCAS